MYCHRSHHTFRHIDEGYTSLSTSQVFALMTMCVNPIWNQSSPIYIPHEVYMVSFA